MDAVELGKRLRLVRKHRRMTLAETAEGAGLSRSFISQIESGRSSPSTASLLRIAKTLGANIGTLFADDPLESIDSADAVPAPQHPVATEDPVKVVRGGSRKLLWWPGSYATRTELLTPDLRGKLEIILQTLPLNDLPSEEPTTHEGEEFGWVIEGALAVTVAGTEHILKEGDTIYFPSHLPHSSRAVGDKDCVKLWVMTPPSF